MGSARRAKEQRRKARKEKQAVKRERVCGECRACCTVLSIPEVDTPAGTPCQHECDKGCAIYRVRPKRCQEFSCGWLHGVGRSADRPDKAGWFVSVERQTSRLFDVVGGANASNTLLVVRAFRSGSVDTPEFRALLRGWVERGSAVLVLERNVVDGASWLYGPRFPKGVQIPTRDISGVQPRT
jgi:hypothetical protein